MPSIESQAQYYSLSKYLHRHNLFINRHSNDSKKELQTQFNFKQKRLMKIQLDVTFRLWKDLLSLLSVVSIEQASSDDLQTAKTAIKRKHSAMFLFSATLFLMLILIVLRTWLFFKKISSLEISFRFLLWSVKNISLFFKDQKYSKNSRQ